MAKIVMLALVCGAIMFTENVYCVPEEVGSKSEVEPACLLQSTFSSNDLSMDTATVVEAVDEASLATFPKSASLFESDALEETSTKDLMLRSKVRSRSCRAHLFYLNRKANGLDRALNVSNVKMDALVKGFISKQSGSQDACSSQLMEAKHQLNQIHEYVMDLVVQVNTTERAILALDKAMDEKIKDVEALDKWKEDELAICEKKKQEYIEMYGKLSDEMKEMKEIASPGVAMDVKTGAVITAEGAVGLVQMMSHPSDATNMKELQLLIKGTQSAAKELLHCMAKTGHKQQISQLQRSVVVDSFEIRDVTEEGEGGKKGKGGQKKTFKLSKKKLSCMQSWGMETATVEEVADACGCDTSKKANKGWCMCPSLLKPLIGQRGEWLLVGLKGGQAMGKGYKYSVKYAPKDAKNTAIDLCVPQKPIVALPRPRPKPITIKPVPIERPEPIKHVDPPEAIGGGQPATGGPDPKPINIKPISISVTRPPPIKHVDPVPEKPKYNCKTREAWSADKKKWCCDNEGICETGGPDPEPQIKPIAIKPVPVERPEPIKHVDPPEAIGGGPANRALTDPTNDESQEGDFDADMESDPGEDYGGVDFDTSASDEGFSTANDALRDESDQAAMDAAKAIKEGGATPEECAAEKKILEETYVKTYVELSRLKDEYNDLANSTACFDTVESTYKSQKAPLQEAIDQLIKDIDKKQKELQGLRPRLESATKAEAELRKHIATLSAECAELPETVSNLNKVRDAIEALSKCPGLARVQFSLPKWTGTWVTLGLKAKKMTDEEQDAALTAACNAASEGTRAAEVGEIAEQTVEGIPETNTADFPLIGTCPNCAGDEAAELPSGHKRICWRQGKDLTSAKKATNCASGKKAVLCVTDRENIRQIPGGF